MPFPAPLPPPPLPHQNCAFACLARVALRASPCAGTPTLLPAFTLTLGQTSWPRGPLMRACGCGTCAVENACGPYPRTLSPSPRCTLALMGRCWPRGPTMAWCACGMLQRGGSASKRSRRRACPPWARSSGLPMTGTFSRPPWTLRCACGIPSPPAACAPCAGTATLGSVPLQCSSVAWGPWGGRRGDVEAVAVAVAVAAAAVVAETVAVVAPENSG